MIKAIIAWNKEIATIGQHVLSLRVLGKTVRLWFMDYSFALPYLLCVNNIILHLHIANLEKYVNRIEDVDMSFDYVEPQ